MFVFILPLSTKVKNDNPENLVRTHKTRNRLYSGKNNINLRSLRSRGIGGFKKTKLHAWGSDLTNETKRESKILSLFYLFPINNDWRTREEKRRAVFDWKWWVSCGTAECLWLLFFSKCSTQLLNHQHRCLCVNYWSRKVFFFF